MYQEQKKNYRERDINLKKIEWDKINSVEGVEYYKYNNAQGERLT